MAVSPCSGATSSVLFVPFRWTISYQHKIIHVLSRAPTEAGGVRRERGWLHLLFTHVSSDVEWQANSLELFVALVYEAVV
jgi:hypothetical protein